MKKLLILTSILLTTTAFAKKKDPIDEMCTKASINLYKFGAICKDYKKTEEELVCIALEANACQKKLDNKKEKCKEERKFFLKCFSKVFSLKDAGECINFPLKNLEKCLEKS